MPDAVADLILARLLVPSKKPPAPGAVEKAVTPLLRKPPAKGFVAAYRPGLQAAGLFRPNQPLPFKHGTKPGEADLLAADFQLAVEIDGAYFHLEAEQYRRDRRKDYSYHRHGYLVLRFLAEDIVVMSETILKTVVEALAHRRAAKSPPEVPPVA